MEKQLFYYVINDSIIRLIYAHRKSNAIVALTVMGYNYVTEANILTPEEYIRQKALLQTTSQN